MALLCDLKFRRSWTVNVMPKSFILQQEIMCQHLTETGQILILLRTVTELSKTYYVASCLLFRAFRKFKFIYVCWYIILRGLWLTLRVTRAVWLRKHMRSVFDRGAWNGEDKSTNYYGLCNEWKNFNFQGVFPLTPKVIYTVFLLLTYIISNMTASVV
jgi:hypothetical protein